MWKINIQAPFKGYLKKWYLDDNINNGESTQANDMDCVDVNNGNCITSGFKNRALLETDEVIYRFSNVDTQDYSYGMSDHKVWKVSSSITSDTNFPHTITGAAACGFWNNAVYYKEAVYYFWHTFSSGDIGKITNLTGTTQTFDDDWGSTNDDNLEEGDYTPVFTTLDEHLIFGNGQYLGWYDGTTLDTKFYDFGDNLRIKTIAEQGGYIYVSVNNPDSDLGTIYILNSDISTEATVVSMISVGDKIYESLVVNGIVYVVHDPTIGEASSKIGYISGDRLVDLDLCGKSFGGQLNFCGDYIFMSGEYGKIMALSTPHSPSEYILTSPISITNISDTGGGGGCKSNGYNLFYSFTGNDGKFYVEYFTLSSQGIAGYWISKTWITADENSDSMIDNIVVNTNKLKATAKCNLEIYINEQDAPIKTLEITGENKYKHIFRNLGISNVDKLKIKLDWSVGVDNKFVEIQKINIKGHNYEK